ncbi:MAG: LysR family transcriptional regulator [Acetobacter okinawensis]
MSMRARRPPLDLRELQCVREIAREGSIHAAARTLGSKQSAVSRLLRLLEERLGMQLFRRTSSGAKLTPAGTMFLRDATESHRFEIQRPQFTKTAWCIRQADDPGCIFPAPDHGFSGYGDVRVVDKNVTSIGPGTPPTGEKDWRWLRPAAKYPYNR